MADLQYCILLYFFHVDRRFATDSDGEMCKWYHDEMVRRQSSGIDAQTFNPTHFTKHTTCDRWVDDWEVLSKRKVPVTTWSGTQRQGTSSFSNVEKHDGANETAILKVMMITGPRC
jgi:hypothetical protein